MTTISSSPLLLEFARRLLEVYQNLLRSNRQFLAEPTSAADAFALFLDERDFALEEIRDLERELLAHHGELFPGESADLAGVLKRLEKSAASEASTLFNDIQEALQQLVAADKEVQTRLNRDKNALSEQLKQIRRGSSSLKGYTPSDPTGSCFIDKIK